MRLSHLRQLLLCIGRVVLSLAIVPILISAALCAVPAADGAEYRISPDDVLDIYVLDVPEVSRQCRVSPEGRISVPLLPEHLPASGFTLDELGSSIGERLRTSGLVSNPHVTVAVVQSRQSSISITGAVHKPQIYPFFGRSTLLDVLSQAEGVEPEAGDLVLLQRRSAAGDSPEKVNLTDLLGGDPAFNLPVYPGDRVTVPRAGIIYVLGAVNKPGGFQLGLNRQRVSLLQAVALAEDLKPTALRGRTVLIRGAGLNGQPRSEIKVDLKSVLRGESPDLPLQADDILFVPDSSSRKLLKRGTEAILQVATGVAIYGRY